MEAGVVKRGDWCVLMLLGVVAGAACSPRSKESIAGIQSAIQSGQTSCAAVVQAYTSATPRPFPVRRLRPLRQLVSAWLADGS